ncbi:hypothetical protein B566_EDAN000843, partial [Ephemera danica]
MQRMDRGICGTWRSGRPSGSSGTSWRTRNRSRGRHGASDVPTARGRVYPRGDELQGGTQFPAGQRRASSSVGQRLGLPEHDGEDAGVRVAMRALHVLHPRSHRRSGCPLR